MEIRKKITTRYVLGITLVELLVVVAIISLLATVAINGYEDLRTSSRDARRQQELTQLALALELYYTEHGSYTQPENMTSDTSCGGLGSQYLDDNGSPIGASAGSGSECVNGDGNPDWDPQSDLRDLITSGVTPVLPIDPTNFPPYYYTYEPQDSGQRYCLRANQLERTGAEFCIGRSHNATDACSGICN